MTMISSQRLHFEYILLFAIISSILLHHGCFKHPQTIPFENQLTTPANGSSSACIDVQGKVLGDIIPHSIVSLYETASLNYSVVINTIKTTRPVKQELVNQTSGFQFDCLSFGEYVFVIPTTSYSGGVGSPLPYEFACQNVSLGIAFQGGDSTYSVGAFSIQKNKFYENSTCIENPFICRVKRGRLYKECPLDLK